MMKKLEVRIHTDFDNGYFELTRENVTRLLTVAKELQAAQDDEEDDLEE